MANTQPAILAPANLWAVFKTSDGGEFRQKVVAFNIHGEAMVLDLDGGYLETPINDHNMLRLEWD